MLWTGKSLKQSVEVGFLQIISAMVFKRFVNDAFRNSPQILAGT